MTPTIAPAQGPERPASSRPRSGVLGGAVFAYGFDPAGGAQRADLVVPTGGLVCPHHILEWAFYSDDSAALGAPWASLAVCVDILFDDGTRVSDGTIDGPMPDRYGVAATAAAQFAAAWAMPEQWNANAVSLAPWTGRRISAVECVLGDASLSAGGPAAPATGFIEVRVRTAEPEAARTPAERVDTRRGSHSGPDFSRGNTVPAVAVPHGFNFVIPATDASDPSWPYRPFVHDDADGRRLEALQFSHQPSPWIGDRGVLQLMPFEGTPRSDRSTRRRTIRPGTESARPHHYSAQLSSSLVVEATATNHAAAFAVHGDGTVGFVIDQLENRGLLAIEANEVGTALSGWVPEGDALWGNAPRMYFAGESRTAHPRHGMLDDAAHRRVAGFVSGTGRTELRIATSFLSVDQARRSLGLEAPWAVSFDQLRDRARDEWDGVCGQIEIAEPAPAEAIRRGLAHEELLSTVTADLYRLHLYPNVGWENAGTQARPDHRFADPFAPAAPHDESSTGCPAARGNLVVNNGYWDTYRTAWPLLCLLEPERTGSLLDGLLEQARRGGWMARWAAPGYVDCMVGTSSDQIFADAFAWGVRTFDAHLAFETGWRNACEPSTDVRMGRAGLATSRFTGVVDREIPESFGWAIEGAISDAALSRFAAQLAATGGDPRHDAFARYLGNRSLAYARLFDGATGFFRSRDSSDEVPTGPFDPRSWGGDYTETNAWGMSVSAVHDGVGLAALHGGPAGLRRHLDRLFAEPETASPDLAGTYGHVIHEQREARALRTGMCAISNQPAHHIPAMYAYGDEPWRAGATIRRLAERLFCGGHIGQGYPGDEDNGEMSAWWLWALIGLYPLAPASGELLVGSPLVDDLTLRPGSDRPFRIRVRRRVPQAQYLVGGRLNGEQLERASVPVTSLARAGELELEFDRTPDPNAPIWNAPAAEVATWRPDRCHRRHAISSAGIDASRLFDDGRTGSAGVTLGPQQWAGQRFDTPVQVTDVSLTAAEAAEVDTWVVEWSHDGTAWYPAPTTHREPLRPDRTTPFRLARSTTATWWRVSAGRTCTLRQIELFDLGA